MQEQNFSYEKDLIFSILSFCYKKEFSFKVILYYIENINNIKILYSKYKKCYF